VTADPQVGEDRRRVADRDATGTGTAQGLLLDYGGVLTTPVGDTFTSFERWLGVPDGLVLRLLAATGDGDGALVARLERGELAPEDFEAELARMLTGVGHRPPPGSLLRRLFAELEPAGRLWEVAVEARDAGRRTGLLSNSWGLGFYPWDRLERVFEVVVISGQVGLRKPNPAIYALAADRLGLPPTAVVFVDDLERNVTAAEQAGMLGVLHRGDELATSQLVRELLGLPSEATLPCDALTPPANRSTGADSSHPDEAVGCAS
jgi:putative hydrolase of the HAD superfamily